MDTEAPMQTRIVIVDDHPITLIGLRYMLSANPDLDIVGQAEDPDGLLDQLEQHPCDVLITDLMMPGGAQSDGLRLIDLVRRRYPRLAIIVVTMLDNPALIAALLRLGVRGVVSKRGMLADLPKAIRANGRQPFLSPSLRHLMEAGHGKPLAQLEALSPREVEVLRLYGSGLAIGEIAERLARSKQTISAQKSSAMRKLGLDTNAGLYLYIQENGLA